MSKLIKCIWIAFNRNGSICSKSITVPDDINDDGYGHKWVEMTTVLDGQVYNDNEAIWVSFNRSGSICSSSTFPPSNHLDDGYGNKWVKMVPVILPTTEMGSDVEASGIRIDFKLNAETQSVGELWESLAKLAQGRVDDNKKSSVYPLDTRERQLKTAKALDRKSVV